VVGLSVEKLEMVLDQTIISFLAHQLLNVIFIKMDLGSTLTAVLI
jgi:hypothetical protein